MDGAFNKRAASATGLSTGGRKGKFENLHLKNSSINIDSNSQKD